MCWMVVAVAATTFLVFSREVVGSKKGNEKPMVRNSVHQKAYIDGSWARGRCDVRDANVDDGGENSVPFVTIPVAKNLWPCQCPSTV